MKRKRTTLMLALAILAFGGVASAEVCNLKVVTDASPDYSDMASLIHSITARWPTPQEKCWALFYWNHIVRRQTAPMMLYGMELTDPIRQFNDYGYTMCSTIAGINCALWHHLGLPVKFWDITLHTVPEVFYDGRWHVYDNSMSALYTLCDGKTIAGVEDVGKEGGCEASGGKVEPGHIARYHCLNATSPNGFLTGADCARDLDQEYRCFNPNGLKYRYYYNNWDWGHRYILNLREDEAYTRYYHSLGDGPEFYVPNNGKDPEAANPRYRIRGNGVWTFKPRLTPADWWKAIHSAANVTAIEPAGLQPEKAGPAEVTFKVQSANVTTSQVIQATFFRRSEEDEAKILVSTTNGLHWKEVWKAEDTGEIQTTLNLLNEVNGAYEVLIKIELTAHAAPADCVLKSLEIQTTTMLNSKTQPRLNLGRNTIYVGAGEQTDSVVFWPELQGGRYKEHIVEERNVTSTPEHIGYQGTIHPVTANEDAYLVYRLDAPRDIVRLTYGGRFYNRAPGSHIDLLYSLDGGKNWTKSWSLTSTEPPWDVIHYETVEIPQGHRSVWVKYLLNTSDPSPSGCSLYAVRLEANYLPALPSLAPPSQRGEGERFPPYEGEIQGGPIEVTFCWSEPQADRTLVERRHTQLVTEVPFKYTINVGGEDHPVMNWLRVNLRGGLEGASTEARPYGGDGGQDVGGEKFVGRWMTCGRNLAVGKPYTLSAPSITNWDAGDPEGKKLTDGIAGPPYAGGISYRWGALWEPHTNPVITLDLGEPTVCASFGMNFHGYEWWDFLKGEVKDRVEVLTSLDGQGYVSRGFLHTDWRWKELPVNWMWPDEETITGATCRLIPEQPVTARYVQYRVTSERFFCCTELEVLDSIRFEPFDLRIALPDEQ